MSKRKVDIVVLSDIHLGTYANLQIPDFHY